MKDYYQILGVAPDASKDEIRTAFRKLSMKIHPDMNDGDTYFSELFKNINEANDVLSNDAKRKEYDESFNKPEEAVVSEEERQAEIKRQAEELLRKQTELRKEQERLMRKQQLDEEVRRKEQKENYVKTVLETTPVAKRKERKSSSVPWLTLLFLAAVAYGGYRLYNNPKVTADEKKDTGTTVSSKQVIKNSSVKKANSKSISALNDSFEIEQQRLDEEMSKRKTEKKENAVPDTSGL